MMAMKFFQPSLTLTRELEFDIWREANLVETYGTSKEGLALAAARRGFDAYTIVNPYAILSWSRSQIRSKTSTIVC